MIRRGQFIFLVFLVLLLSILLFVGCNKSSKNVGISNEDAQKLSLDGITVAGNGTENISNLIRDKSGKENNIKKRETSGDGQLKYDITIQDHGASENYGFDFITVDKTSAAPGETVTFQTHVQWVNDSHTEKREISSIAIEGEYVEIQNNSFVMPARDANILVMIGTYRKLVIQQPSNGRISTNKEWYNVGMQEDIVITLDPDSGYVYKENTLVLGWEVGYGPESETLYVDGETKTATHYLPASYSEITLTCEFEISQAPTYGVSVGYIQNGTISPTKNIYEENEKVVVTVNPDKDYELDELWYDESTQITKENNEYFFNMPNHDVTLHATFKEKKYLITVIHENGTVVLKHEDNVLEGNKSKQGESVKIYVSPNDGYLLESIRLSDKNIIIKKNEGDYEFTMPEKDIILTASFVTNEEAIAVEHYGYIPTSEDLSEITSGTHYTFWNSIRSEVIDLVYIDNMIKYDDDSFRVIYCIEIFGHLDSPQNELQELISNCLSGLYLTIYPGDGGAPIKALFEDNNLDVVYDIGDNSQKAYIICSAFENGNAFHKDDPVYGSILEFLYVDE